MTVQDGLYKEQFLRDRKDFFASRFKLILKDAEIFFEDLQLPQVGRDRLRECLNYNVPGGKLNRGLAIVDSLLILKESASDEEIFTAIILGWCVEILQAYLLIGDDIMDHSLTRRGKPCWYKVQNTGFLAVNEAMLLKSFVFKILRMHFEKVSYYLPIMDLFNEVCLITEIGQEIDLLTAPEGKVSLANFSMDRYDFIITHKTAYYSFYLPVAVAMHIAGLKNRNDFDTAKRILLDIGKYFQVQDDYLDCYGDPEIIGKIGSDIVDNKCTWLINQAIMKANSSQLQILEQSYGQKTPICIENVKFIYQSLNLPELYKNYEDRTVDSIKYDIDKVDESHGFKREVLKSFLAKIYKRSK